MSEQNHSSQVTDQENIETTGLPNQIDRLGAEALGRAMYSTNNVPEENELAKQGHQETLRRAREIVAMLGTLDLSDRDRALAYLGELATDVLDNASVDKTDKTGVPQMVLDQYAKFGLKPLTDEAARTFEQDTIDIETRGDREEAVEKAIEATLRELKRRGTLISPRYISVVTNWVYSRFSQEQKDVA